MSTRRLRSSDGPRPASHDPLLARDSSVSIEAELCKRYGASRTVTREAVETLSAKRHTAQFAVYNLTAVVEPNTTYQVSAWALHKGLRTTPCLAAKVECTAATEPGGHDTYPWLDSNAAVVPDTWTHFSADLQIPDCDVVDVAIFFEGTTAGVDVYLDDITVLAP